MRMLFETPTWWPNTDRIEDPVIKMYAVGLSDCADASKRDLVFRIWANEEPAGVVNIYAFRNYADASAATCSGVDPDDFAASNKVLAYASDITIPAATRTVVVLTNNANYGPDMTDLSVTYTGTGHLGDWDKYYHYTSNIAEATLRGITAVLKEYIGTACALEDFDVFGIEYGREGRKSRRNQILIRYSDEVPSIGSQGRFSVEVGFHVDVYMIGDPEGVEHDAVRNGNAIWSILGDERRKLDDFCNLGITIDGMSEPQVLTQENAGIAGQMVMISGVARYKDVHCMDINL